MTDNEARAREVDELSLELATVNTKDGRKRVNFGQANRIRAALDAAYERGKVAGLREARKLYYDGSGPGDGLWDYFHDFASAIDARLTALEPSPPANRGEG